MNRIYNVIWSKAKKCYVVVSELVKNGGGKTKSVHTGASWARMSVIMAVAVLLAGINIGTVNAALIIDGAAGGHATGRDQYSSSNYLYNYKNPGNMAALDGSGSASGYYTRTSFSGVALGAKADIQETGDPSAYSGVAVGSYAKATGGLAYAIGSYAQATNSSSMAIGTATLSSGFNSLAMMRQSAATKDFSTAIGTAAWADGVGSFAMGYSATAKGEQSIAIGAAETKKIAGGQGGIPSAEYNGDGNTVTEGARSLAFGTTARTTSAASDSMAFGSKANTSGANAVAMGYNAQAKATDSFAIGNTAVSTGTGATAMGKSAQATGTSSFALGSGSSAAGTDSIAMGSSSLAKMANSIALGGNAKSQGADALAIGGAANAGNTGAIALGKGAQAVSANSTAIGSGATVTGANAMAIGTNAKASTPNSLALGSGTEITKTLTDGYSAFTNEINHNYVMGVVAVGNDGVGRRITNVAGGEDDTDAANIKQLKYVNSNLAQSIAGSSYTGYEANGSTYKAPDFNIKNSTYHTVKEAVEAAQTNFFSAKGDSSDANYDNTGATGTNATAAGVRTSAAGNYGTAVGADASAANANSTAIGYKAKSSVNDGVALGSDSVASVAAGKTGYNVGTANSRTNTYSGLTGAALTSALGAVSVGDGGTKTRQITNVAAGTADTDAVNVAQLRNVNLKVAGNTNANGGRNDVLLDNQTLTVKGDGIYITTAANNQTIDVALTDATKKKIDNAADKDLSNITDTAKKNITALGTVVQAGNNVTVGAPAVDATTGQKTYTVNGMDTKVSLGSSGLMTLSGGTPDASGVRNYIVDVDPAKVAKTDLSNITDGGRTVIREEAKNSVKVVAGKNTTVTEGTDGTYKTYKVDVDAPDYQLVENSGAADKAYTVSGNKVDLTVQDAKNPAAKKTVTIKDIASKTELDKVQDRSVKYDGAAGKDTVTLEGAGGTKITNLQDGTVASGSKDAVNGGQLHDAKTELNNTINNTKNDVINTGLRFDADNNSEKTNKLGSKVAVNGDSNITTEITQSGDDTKIGIKLNQDLNVKTVTAVDTVKAGGVTVGKQADGTNPTVGNYVTGLDNKNWDASNIVSGRAATEDQLKKALDKQSADATDYRLIRNQATGSNGDYTVDGNGDVALTVQDKNHTDKTETVTIKDVASKSAMDKGLNFDGDSGAVINKKLSEKISVKGGADTSKLSDGNIGVVSDGNGTLNVKLAKTLTGLDSVTAGGTTINSSGLTVGGKTYVSSNGIDANSQKITNVADGNVTAGSKEAVNGGQLHQVKQDLGDQITNTANTINNRIDTTKQDLIDKGLQFDADNNDAKTNKLGSRITVTGDGTNISTAVTQSGDDTTIKVALGQDINVNTVTAIKTVKAGTAVMGNQSVTDNKAAAQAGNFVTGLDNKSWTISDPVYVSGRAATEDQLKTVSDAVKAANASATDYRLIGDPNNAVDGSYKVDNNRVDLKVKDDKTGTVNTVTIKDIASKTELDKVQDRSVKYDGTAGKDTVTLEGVNGTKITNLQDGNVASGSKDAVNGGQLHDAKNELNTNITNAKNDVINTGLRFDADNNSEKTNKLGSKVTVKGDNANIITEISQDGNGDSTIDVKLGKDLKTETITATGANGKDGKIGINGKDGVTTNISVTRDGQPGVDGAAGTTTTRIVYQKPDGTNEEVATLNDGLKFKGDMGATSNVKLNKQVDITGGVTSASDLATGNNIGVTSAAVDADGNAKLQLQLAKNLTGLQSVTASDTVKAGTAAMGNQSVTDNKSAAQAGNFVTGLDNKTWTMSDPAYVSGRAATEDQLKTVSDAVKAANASATDYRLVENANAADKAYTADASGNIKLTVEDKNHAGQTETVTIKDVASKSAMDKGLNFDGDSGTTINKKLGDTVAVKGGADTSKLADGNIGVVSDGNGTLNVKLAKTLTGLDSVTAGGTTIDSNGLTVGGKTYVSSNGINANDQKITNVADGNVAAGSKEAVNGSQLHQVKQDLGDQITDTTNTINNKIDATKQDLINTGLKFDANVGGEQTNKLGSKVTVKGEGNAADTDYSGENIKTFITQDASGHTTIDVKMNKNVVADTIKVNKNGKDGKDGVSITGPAGVAGQDGNNGKVGITGADGKDAVSMSGKDGVGHIGLTGPAGTNGVNGTNGIDISVKNGYDDAGKGVKGEKGVDGVDGITRIVYQDKTGEHQVATMEDGLQFTGNNTGTVNKQKLNSLVKIQGEGVTETASGTFTSASGNINVKANGTDTLELQLAKDLKNLDSVTATKTVKAGTVTMGDQTVTNTKGTAETGNYVTGLDNTDWAADKIVSGRAATEDQLKKALDKQSADATDYRLIRNQATGSNGDYTVDGNGDVALTVQDKNHTDKTETVTIKDVASKSAVDKLTDRAVKYALDGSGSPDKTKVAYEGPVYTNKTGGTHVTNVAYAAGTDGSEAVNVDYLNDKIKANADTLTDTGLKFDANTGGEKTNKLGSKVTVKGEGAAADTDYSGENIKTFITQDASGNTTIDVKMNKNVVADTIKVNKNGKDGKDGVSITGPAGVAGQDGNNGKVGITGADGKDAVSMSGKDGVGHIGLTGPAGTNGVNGTNGIDISVKNGYDDVSKGVKGEKGVDGADGITRIVYQDKTGEHQVATMDDGMLYGGDGGTVIKKKLNNQVNIKGGISDESKLSTDANIGVMSDGTDTLMLRLAKDLKGLNSATFNNGTNGTTVVNGGGMSINDAAGNPLTSVTKDGVTITNGPSMTTGGIDAANKQIINVADGKVETGSKDAVNGGQLADQIESVTKSITEKGFGLTAEDGQTVKKSLGETVTVKGDGTNIKTSVDNGIVKVELKKEINVDTVKANKVTTGNTTMDTNGVTIKDGTNEAAKLTKDGLQINDGGNKAVTVNKDGLTIENGPKVTKDGIDAADKKITNVADGTVGAGSKDAVNGGQLHTAIEDIKSAGFGLTAEDGQSVKKPLGSTIDLKGDGNIKTSVDGDAVKISLNDKLTIGQDPAKQVKVDGATGSVTAGDGTKQVKMDGAAGTITAGSGVNRVKVDGNDGSVTANTVKAGDVVAGRQSSGGQTGNFVTGLDNKTWNADNPAAVTGRAATEDQLKVVNDDFNNKAKTGRVFQGDQSGDDGKVVRGLGDTMNLTGGADVNRLTDNNIGVVKNSAGDGYNIKLAKDINMGDGSTSYTKAVAGTNTTVPYTVQTKVDGQGVTITPSVNGRPVSNHTVSLTENGLNNGNNTITNVAPGVNGTDAVNVNQLSSVMRNMDGKVADVGAASAAISGLKPLQYDPLEPTQVLAAVGHYKGSTAAAVGLAHYTNESTMFHMGVSIGGHDNMVNAGVSYKFGTSDAKKAVPERYKGGPISSMYVMQDEMTALKAENERMKKHDEELTAKYDQVQRDNEEMKAQIALLIQKAGIKK